MTPGFLLSRVLLKFDREEDDLLEELSAIAHTPDGSLWLGSDEFVTVERLSPMGDHTYGAHKVFHLNDYISLAGTDSEIDIEGMDYSDGYLWIVGSHSLKRNKTEGDDIEDDIQRLSEIERDPNRYLLTRIPLINGELAQTAAHPEAGNALSAAVLQRTDNHEDQLMEVLAKDEHLGPFLQMGLPSKDNGFDIEGIAVKGRRVFLGLRGPVLRGWAIVLELEPEDSEPGQLALKELEDGVFYRKHFLNLGGLGVRELCFDGEDLIILAGPTMDLEGAMQVFRLEDALGHGQNTLWDSDADELSVMFDLPFTIGSDHAEGLALFPCFQDQVGLMVAYDSPDQRRIASQKSLFVDVFHLPD
ncbi:DUF3616 domain-containing protein [filamentous cyanobacterium CCP5]|nr:DUF3616 domain-containing protein [filamentous cyanobacterium CCP5]